MKQLPRYVYDNSDYVPPARLEDSDMRILLPKWKKMETIQYLEFLRYKQGAPWIQANVALQDDDSSQVQLRPPSKSAFRVDSS